METPQDHVLIQRNIQEKTEVQYNSLKLHIDPLYDPERHKHVISEVVGLPRKISKEYKRTQLPKVGETIFYKYLEMHESANVYRPEEGKNYIRINVNFIIATITENDFEAFQGWAILKPIYDDDVIIEDGIPMKMSGGVISSINVAHNPQKAELVKIGKPLEGEEPLDLKPGDIVYYEPHADFDNVGNKIHGEKYFYMNQEDLLMKESC